MKEYVAYYRVSTKMQGESGLGLESQKSIIERFIEQEKQKTGKPICLMNEFTDIETGKNSNRQGLNNAIEFVRNRSVRGKECVLLIAKLDRLSRNIHFITNLMESQIKFLACDMPEANNFTIHIFAALAQQEAEMISKRTKDALRAFKERNKDGFIDKYGNFREKLGNAQNFTNESRLKGSKKNKEISFNDEYNIRARNYSKVLREQGMSLSDIAIKLNLDGFRSVTGAKFSAIQIKRLLDSIGVKKPVPKEENQ